MADKPGNNFHPDMPSEEWVAKLQAGIHDMIQRARPKIENGVHGIIDVMPQHKPFEIHQQSSIWTKPAVTKTGLAIGAIIVITAGVCLYAYWRRGDETSEGDSQGLINNREEPTGEKVKNAWNKFWNRE